MKIDVRYLVCFSQQCLLAKRILAINVGPTISCDSENQEYLDISRLECVKCNDGR